MKVKKKWSKSKHTVKIKGITYEASMKDKRRVVKSVISKNQLRNKKFQKL